MKKTRLRNPKTKTEKDVLEMYVPVYLAEGWEHVEEPKADPEPEKGKAK